MNLATLADRVDIVLETMSVHADCELQGYLVDVVRDAMSRH